MAVPTPNDIKYLQNMAAGKTATGGAANAGQVKWAQAQLKVATPPVTTNKPVTTTAKPVGPVTAKTTVPAPDPYKAYGGKDAYQVSQQGRFDKAYTSGDLDLVGRLMDDSKRAGYTLKVPTPQDTKPKDGPTGGTPNVGSTTSTPAAVDAVTTTRTSKDLQQQAGDSLAIERANLLRAANEKLASLRNNANYANQLIADQRTLENAKFQRSTNPFNGRTSYDAAMLGRGRQIDDNQRMGELTNQMNAIGQELYDFDKLTPQRQREIYNDLLAMERQFGLQQGQLTGNYGGNRTLAGQGLDLQRDQFEWGQNMDMADRFGSYQGQQTLAAQSQSFNQNFANQQFEYGKTRDQVGDSQWEQQFNQGVLESNRNFQMDQVKFQESIRQNGIDNALRQAGLAQDAQQFAASQGLRWAELSQRDKEYAADQVWKQKNYELSVRQEDRLGQENTPQGIDMETVLKMAQNDPRYQMAVTPQEQQKIIDFYLGQMGGSPSNISYGGSGAGLYGPPSPSGGWGNVTDNDILKYLKK